MAFTTRNEAVRGTTNFCTMISIQSSGFVSTPNWGQYFLPRHWTYTLPLPIQVPFLTFVPTFQFQSSFQVQLDDQSLSRGPWSGKQSVGRCSIRQKTLQWSAGVVRQGVTDKLVPDPVVAAPS